MITRGFGKNSKSVLLTRGLGKVTTYISVPSVTYIIPEDKQIILGQLLAGTGINTNFLESGIYNTDFIEKSSVFDKNIDGNIFTSVFTDKNTIQENFIESIGENNKSVKGTQSNKESMGSNVSTRKVIE